MQRIVIKVGSNVLTMPSGKLDITRLSSLVDQIAWLKSQGYQVILVSSGAVACGRGELKVENPLDSVEQRQLFSAIGQVKLVNLYYDLFREYGIHMGQVLTMKENFEPGEQFDNQRQCMEVMLHNDVIPVVNENDTVSVTELMFTDNDELSGTMARMMGADILVILSAIDGMYDGDPSDPASRLIPEIHQDAAGNIEACITEGRSSAGRGGMKTKCGVALSVSAAGIPVVIANGRRPDVLLKLIRGDEDMPCTRFSI